MRLKSTENNSILTLLPENYSEKPLSPNLSLETSLGLLSTITEAADDRKAADIVLLNVSEISYLADYFAIFTGFSKTQVRAIADSIEEKVKEQYNRCPLRVEGKTEGNWVVMDYGEAIAHIMLPKEREFYNLEAFWGGATPIELNL